METAHYVGGYLFLIFAAESVATETFLPHCADEMAELTGLGRLIIDSILLAGATSLPGLSVDIACTRQGRPDLAVGDLLGSCLMNLRVPAVLDLTHHSRGKCFRYKPRAMRRGDGERRTDLDRRRFAV